MTNATMWLILCGICLVGEVFTVGFLLFFPGVGAIFAFIAALLNFNFIIQMSVFAVSTILLIIFIRPLVTKLLTVKQASPMNSESLIGKKGVVLKEIKGDDRGQVKVAGEIWSAVCDENDIIEKDTTIVVKEIKGIKLFVDKK